MVYDCFSFFNELDLLEIRLNVLNKVVDKFILVEATKTHSGKDKPLYYLENRDRFQEFDSKIIYIKIEEYPSFFSSWMYENYQRNKILEGLKDCKSDDVVMISDLDEIPNPDAVKNYKSNGIFKLEQVSFSFYLNYKAIFNDKWYGTNILTYGDIASGAIENYRYAYSNTFLKELNEGSTPTKIRFIEDYGIIRNGGWHFTYMGGIEKIKYKLDSFAHQEVNTKKYNLDEIIARKIKKGLDLFDRKDIRSMPVRIDSSFPYYIVENKTNYESMIFPVSNAMLVRNIFFQIRMYLYYYCFRIPYKTLRKCKKALFVSLQK